MIDIFPWDEADLKVKSLIYLSLGAEGNRTFHQRNPHIRIERCTTNELVHELTLTFTRPRNRTFDRFQCSKSMQQPNDLFESFYSRLREQRAHCKFEQLEEDLLKDIFISNMRSSNTQMELLSETRTPQQALNNAVNRERGLANQQEILRSNNTNWNTVSYVRTNRQRTYNQNTQQKPNPCWKCGGTFSLAHLQTRPAKTTTCKICKEARHYTSLCTAKMPERRPHNTPQSSSAQNYKSPQTRRIRNINQEKSESEQMEESVDAEAALYIKELHEDWANINIIRPTQFSPQKNNFISKESKGEFWVETTTQSHKLQWLADTGSPRSFINQEIAQQLQKEIQNIRIEKFTENTIYKFFNKNIEIEGVLIIDIKSGSWTAKSCKVLIVKNNTKNIMGRDLLAKLGITLNASKKIGKPINFISDLQTEKNIIKWVFQKCPHLCTRLGRSKNHIAKSIFKPEYTPSQHKVRRVPLHLLEKVEK